ncbi:MAG: MFS transporter [Verrucomicrobiota bacterium]|nr:MFS transporter [Verrucomicrobiota bacterium]
MSERISREQWKLMGALSLFWATLFGSLGIFFPYYSLYLEDDLGLSGQQIGLAMAVFHLVGLVGQPSWGYLADRTGARKILLVVITIGMALGFVALWHVGGYAALLIASMFFAAFYTSLIPQGMALSLGVLYRSHNSHFEWVRSFGSLGFLITCFGFPLFLDLLDPAPNAGGLDMMFPCCAVLILLTTGVVFLIPNETAIREKAKPGAWRLLAADRRFLRFLLYVFLANFMLDGPMFLFPVFVKSVAPDNFLGTLKWLWLIMLLPEIVAIALAGHIRRRIGVRALMFSGLAAGGLKWLACGFLGDLPVVLYASMLLHCVYVVGALVAMPLCVNYLVPTELRSTGQGLATMISSSLGGGICSSFAAGWLIDHVGPAAPQLYGGIGAMLLLLVAPFLVPKVGPRPVD